MASLGLSKNRLSKNDRIPQGFAEAEEAMGVGLERMAQAGNYLRWLADLCEPHLGPKCLELGSGRGDLTELLARGRTMHASDLSDQLLNVLETRFASSANITIGRIDVADFTPTDRYDAIVMVNVLEHIADDGAAVRALKTALAPGGRLVVLVPAFMLLYSKFDREIGHYRRYRKRQLVDLLQRAGYDVSEFRYVNSLGALGWFAYCRLLGRKSSDQLTVSACDRVVVPVVRRIERRVPPPFGLSAFIVGRNV